MDLLQSWLDRNRRWVEQRRKTDPSYFDRLADTQPTSALLIGCCDSRVPPSVVLDSRPGELFVHRNVANLALAHDDNLLAVLDYAVNVSRVRIVIVFGHYGCGGINAYLHSRETRYLDAWLKEVEDVARAHEGELDAIDDQARRADRLCELNVARQVENLRNNPIIEAQWAGGADLRIYGVIYNPRDGLLRGGEWIAKRPA